MSLGQGNERGSMTMLKGLRSTWRWALLAALVGEAFAAPMIPAQAVIAGSQQVRGTATAKRVGSGVAWTAWTRGTAFASGAPVAQAASDFVIQAGAVHPTVPAKPFEYTRFYPKSLQIHRGQTVTWKTVGWPAAGFHTATFMPSSGPERPALLRMDEVPQYLNHPEQRWQASACGHLGEAVCVLSDTNTFISSGIPPFNPGLEFSVTVDLPNGAYQYVCTIHPSMNGSLEVVDDANSLPSQSDIDAQTATDIAADSANAEALETQDPGFRLDGDRKIWNVLLGDTTADNNVSVIQFIPANLQIAAGDGVRYFLEDNIVNEIHTVSFPAELSGGRDLGGQGLPWGKGGFGIFPRCDPDDPLTGLPGVTGFLCPAPFNLELGLAPWMTTPRAAPGNMVTPLMIHDSGLMVPAGAPDDHRALPGTGTFMPTGFDAEFPVAGTFQYKCNVHPDPMTGSVTVS